jgi:hypothetical protein
MRHSLFAAGIAAGIVVSTSSAFAAEVQPCPQRVGLDAIFPPFEKHLRYFSKSEIRVFNVDTVEPVGSPKGIVVIFNPGSEPTTKCFYIGEYPSVSDVSTAKVTEADDRQLLIVLKTGGYGDNGPLPPTKELKVRINAKQGTVKIE